MSELVEPGRVRTTAAWIAAVESEFRDRVPGAFFVWPRVLRRVLRHQLEITSPWVRVPHRKSCVIERDRLVWLVALDELELRPGEELPERAILIARPEEDRLPAMTAESLRREYWRLLFHGVIDKQLQAAFDPQRLTVAALRQRIDRLGQEAFDEVRAVLKYEGMLMHPDDPRNVYAEFVAVFGELRFFAPDLLPLYFPSLADLDQAAALADEDGHYEAVLTQTRPVSAGLQDPRIPAPPPVAPLVVPETMRIPSTKASAWIYRRAERQAERHRERGNDVRAALWRQIAVEASLAETRREAEAQRLADGERLAARLKGALKLSEADLPAWSQTLAELLPGATHGFWNANARLLYDLQKVCLDHEREVSRVDLGRWLLTGGVSPLKRPLPQLRPVLMTKHLRSALRRVGAVTLSNESRATLSTLLHQAVDQADSLMRANVQPVLAEVLTSVGIGPKSVVERVAFRKLTAELLDSVGERGFLTIGNLRDSVSRSQLKLPDLRSPDEFAQGDALLQADRRLAGALDGVYQPGAFYLRWLQSLTSIAFGTRSGRNVTLYAALPFGGAFIILKGLHHLVEEILHLTSHVTVAPKPAAASVESPPPASETGEPTTTAGAPAAAAASTESATSVTEPAPTDPSPTEPLPTEPAPRGLPSPPSAATIDPSESAAPANPVTPADRPTGPPTDEASTELRSADEASSGPSVAVAEDASHSRDGHSAAASAATAHTATAHAADHSHKFVVPIYSHESMLILGCLLFALIHSSLVRRSMGSFLRGIWKLGRFLSVDFPRALLRWPPVAWLLKSVPALVFRRYLLSPLLITLAARIGWPLFVTGTPLAWGWQLAVFATAFAILNSRLGRDTEELFWEWLARLWHRIRVTFIIGLFNLIIDVFRQVMDGIERVLYVVDELLRFRSGESAVALGIKAVFGLIWGFLQAVIRFCVTLLIEPQVNPIKHFPVVTVSHKLLLPTIPTLAIILETFFDKYTATATATAIVTGIPGLFGFLAWELKENWRLYAANRSRVLSPVLVGHHGETVLRLLKPGFHSGTIPKLFAKQRRAARKARGQAAASRAPVFAEKLHHEAEALQKFVEREFLGLLRESQRFRNEQLRIASVDLATNRIRITIEHAGHPATPVVVSFAEQSGWLIAGLTDPGWSRQLAADQRVVFATALAGLYQLSRTDLVREQIERQMGSPSFPYDIAENGLVVWPTRSFETEVHYSLKERPTLTPRPRSIARAAGLEPLPASALIFREHELAWTAWRDFWTAESEDQVCPSPLLKEIVLPA